MASASGAVAAPQGQRIPRLKDSVKPTGHPVAGGVAALKLHVSLPAGDKLVKYTILFGDVSKGARGRRLPGTIKHVYGRPGKYKVTLRVWDNHMHTAVATHSIVILRKPTFAGGGATAVDGLGAAPTVGTLSPSTAPSTPSTPSTPTLTSTPTPTPDPSAAFCPTTATSSVSSAYTNHSVAWHRTVLVLDAGALLNEPDDLADALEAGGYTGDISSTLPSDLSPYGQIWRVGLNAFSASDEAALLAYSRSGGAVFLTGEHSGFDATVNDVDTQLVDAALGSNVVVGRQGTIGGKGVPEVETFCPLAPGSLATSPNSVTTLTVTYAGGMANVPRANVAAVTASGIPVAAAWPENAAAGHGAIVVVTDMNWLTVGYRGANWVEVAENFGQCMSD